MSSRQQGPNWPEEGAAAAVVLSLRRALMVDRVSHAYLFLGGEMEASLALARTFASALLCTGLEKPCGLCRSCRLTAAVSHPDLTEIEPEGQSIRISQVRSLIGAAHIKPVESERKIYILQSADSLTEQGANALLKLLEEPPAGVVILLLSQSGDLPLTVISRCQVLRLGSALPGSGKDRDEMADLADEWLFLSTPERLSRLRDLPSDRAELQSLIEHLLWHVRNAYMLSVEATPVGEDAGKVASRLAEQLPRNELVSKWEALQRSQRLAAANVNRRALTDNLLWGHLNEVKQ